MDGRSYYAVSSDFNAKDADEWVYRNVIQNIEIEWIKSYSGDGRNKILDRIEGKGRYGAVKIMQNEIGKSNKQIADEIRNFCKSDRDYSHQGTTIAFSKIKNPEFYAYYAAYDWVLFCSLFGRMIDLPKGFPMYCNDLKQMFDEVANTYTSEQLSKIEYPTVAHDVLAFLGRNGILDKPEHLKKHKDYPKQEKEHSAIDDARWNVKLFDFIQKNRL